jgi:long-chain acyl-CoA synthetase
VENVFKHCPAVDQIWVYGNSMESMLVAVVVPSEGHAQKWAADSKLSKTDLKVTPQNMKI